jgi:hypothetical protein
LKISIAVVLDLSRTRDLHRTIERAFEGRDDGPWDIWLGPHESDHARWRLRLTCPGYTTTVSLGPFEQSPLGLAKRLDEILSVPVGCLRPAESA